ncbi:MAG: triacylglycerol lipase, partial [Deltaproteobacteria bacterium]|nr:triacylglycerol lipase [Deltaproteobacteria bacterium]
MIHRVYLIPGFFGFADLGGITYFHHVERTLSRRLDLARVPHTITPVGTRPTASIRARARALAGAIHATSRAEDRIYLVGHSAGGLDARLFTSPGAALETDLPIEAMASRVGAVITLSTPHFGTPLASFFSTIAGEKVLFALSLLTIYVLRFGRVPLGFAGLLTRGLTRLDDIVGLENTVLDELYDSLLVDFSPAKRDVIRDFLEEVRRERGIVSQLTPDGIDLFNASVAARPGVEYLSVITVAPPPTARSFLELASNPYALAQHAVYTALHR